MAIKTQTELVTQSDNTFLDNTTGQIIPTNHRTWNEDVLDTMFGAIAGQRVTKVEFDDLVTNNLLIVNSIYTITDFQLNTNHSGEINVLAVSNNSVMPFAFSTNVNFYGILEVDSGVTTAKICKNFGKGINEGDWGSFKTNLITTGTFAQGAQFTFNQIVGVGGPFIAYHAIMSCQTANAVAQHNIYGEPSGVPQLFKGFLPIGGLNNENCFYPDHGTQDTWGDYGIIAAGNFGQLTINDQTNLTNFTDIKGNYQKVNNMIFGQIHFQCDYDVNAQDYLGLPMPFATQIVGGNFIGHGAAVSTSAAYHFSIRGITITGGVGGQDAQFEIDIIGNHNGTLPIIVDLTFSYSLGY